MNCNDLPFASNANTTKNLTSAHQRLITVFRAGLVWLSLSRWGCHDGDACILMDMEQRIVLDIMNHDIS